LNPVATAADPETDSDTESDIDSDSESSPMGLYTYVCTNI